jgi:hypothetical protein
MDEKIKIKVREISQNALGAAAVSGIIIELIKVIFSVQNIRIIYIGIIGIIFAITSFAILKERKILRVGIPILILVAAFSLSLFAIKYCQDDATVRINQFEKEVNKIEAMELSEGIKCEYLVKALKKLQDDDKKSASRSQIDILNRVRECHERLSTSDDHWRQVIKSYNAFNSGKALASAVEFITAMKQLDGFDKSRNIKEQRECERQFEEVKTDIGKLNEITKALKELNLNYHQDSQKLKATKNIGTLLSEYENLLIRYKPGDIDYSQQQAIMRAYEIKNYKTSGEIPINGVEDKNHITPVQPDEMANIKKHQEGQRNEVFIDTSALTDRNLEPLKDILIKKLKNKGFTLSPFQDADILKVKILPPLDHRAIMSFPVDSEGKSKYQVSVNVQLFLASKGVNKDFGNIKIPGFGSSELEALQKAQENVSNDIADKLIDSLRKLDM